MDISVRDATITLAVIGGLVFAFSQLPDFRSDQTRQRQYVLEDRKYNEAIKTAALNEMRACFKDANDSYHANWSRACKTDAEERINQCLSDGVPEKVCRAKIVFSSDCALAGHKADRINGYLDSAKSECHSMFLLESK